MQHPTGLQAWVSDLAGTLLPSIVHNGVTYCVATPGQEFSVTVSRDAGSLHAYTPDMLVRRRRGWVQWHGSAMPGSGQPSQQLM
jgi:hypothetical protein